MNDTLYYKYSDYLKDVYGCKVYKLPVNLPITCPNRIHGQGCAFCAEIGTGFESLENHLNIKEQLEQNKAYISNKYHAQRFIAYFQNYTNTYLPLSDFQASVNQVREVRDIVELSISTRPDCIRDDYLDFLLDFSSETGIRINFELGLQTINYHTLQQIHRGHGLAEFIDAVLRIKKYPFTVCTHVILNLPGDDDLDAVETSRCISVLPVDIVKVHSLYIPKHCEMADRYLNHTLKLCSKEAYLHRLLLFVEYLRPDIAIERLFARVPEKDALFCNWQTSWWKLQDEFTELMKFNQSFQGKRFCYTNGSALDF